MKDRMQPVDLGILLALAYQAFVRELHVALAREGFDDIGRSDGYVFRALATRPMTVSELATRLEISKQGAGQIIDDMERRRYVQRNVDPSDARARLVHLSARGEAALASARRFHRTYEQGLVRRHGRDAVASLRAVLAGMAGTDTETVDPRLRSIYI